MYVCIYVCLSIILVASCSVCSKLSHQSEFSMYYFRVIITTDSSSRHANRQIIFEDVRVPVGNRIGAEGRGFVMAMNGLNGGRLSIGSLSLGAAQKCFELALAYVKDRKQFGKPIGDNQAIQFKLADMAADVHLSRLALRSAAALLDADSPIAPAHCAMAKRIATDKGFDVCNAALQLHGGYGYLKV